MPYFGDLLTMRTRYALKALTALSEHQRSGIRSTLIQDLARGQGIPRKFLEAILRELKRLGIVASQRGPGGGYALRRLPHEITIASVVEGLNGSARKTSCSYASAHCAECNAGRPCRVARFLGDLHRATREVLERTTIADLVDSSVDLDPGVPGAEARGPRAAERT